MSSCDIAMIKVQTQITDTARNLIENQIGSPGVEATNLTQWLTEATAEKLARAGVEPPRIGKEPRLQDLPRGYRSWIQKMIQFHATADEDHIRGLHALVATFLRLTQK